MAYKFQAGDKEVTEHKDYMPFGVNTVKLVGAVSSQTEAGKDYIELTVENADGIEDNARVWFTGKASPYSYQTIQQIIVHSAKTDSAKEKARQAVEACQDSDELANLLNAKCEGAELWVTKYYDPTRTYENANGEVKRSINTNVYGYEPKLKPELMPKDEPVDNSVHGAAQFANNAATQAKASGDTVAIPAEWN